MTCHIRLLSTLCAQCIHLQAHSFVLEENRALKKRLESVNWLAQEVVSVFLPAISSPPPWWHQGLDSHDIKALIASLVASRP